MDSRKRRYEIKSNEIRNLKRRRNRNRNRNRDRNKYRNKYRNKEVISLFIIIALVGAIGIFTCIFLLFQQKKEKPQELIQKYMNYITAKDYENMYQMINIEGSGGISQEDFEKRNAAIYEGIEMEHMKVKVSEYDKKEMCVKYQTSFDTVAGNICFDNEAYFVKGKEGYQLLWNDGLIFPELEAGDKVKVSRTAAERGEVLDRNDYTLAGKGTASSVGIVPGKLENREQAVAEMAELLGIEPEHIEKELEAKWVQDDSFVPIKTIPKISEIEELSPYPEDEEVEEDERQEKLLAIPGIMISDTEVRAYPLGEAAAHLVGYVQNVTAEDLEKHAGEGYTANSVIGRSGMEGLYERELKGQDGYAVYITDKEGNKKTDLAKVMVQNGENIKLTIDVKVQKSLYEQFQEDKSCSVAMNPYTGEVLALVSTPSFDDNDFIMGMSSEKWDSLNTDERKPLYNRFRQVWCPGSTFKPVIASIGLETGTINPEEDYGNVGLRWQKDTSWGSYYVTTLHAYEPVILENALIYSDNIYFAKAALKIGAENLIHSLQKIGFNEKIPFEITMSTSQYSNTDKLETEIQLADSGYGQGQILINPLHLASIYTSFCNDGTVRKPYLRYQEEPKAEDWSPNAEDWFSNAFSSETAQCVLEGLKQVVNNPHGTGYGAHMDTIALAGKTGTAEIKASKEDTTGTELGWFAVFTTEKELEKPILIVSMVEDVKEIGGSGYVVNKDRNVLDSYLN